MATLRKGLLWQQDILCYGNTATERVYYGNKISFVMATLRKGLLWQQDILCYGNTGNRKGLLWQQDILCYGNTEKGFIMATRYPLLWQH